MAADTDVFAFRLEPKGNPGIAKIKSIRPESECAAM
jgi:hypothetical protein